MFELFKKIGIPEHPLNEIKELYKDFKIQVSIEKCKNLVDYTTGVEQTTTLLPFFLSSL